MLCVLPTAKTGLEMTIALVRHTCSIFTSTKMNNSFPFKWNINIYKYIL
jgi:hypothetical protein